MAHSFIDMIGYEGFYKIDNKGNILSVKRNIIMKYFISNSGYRMINLNKKSERRKFYIHRLVAINFIGNPTSKKHEVAHNDGNKQNNHFKNLRWATRSENFRDKIRHGTETLGERHGRHKLTESDVIEIRKKAISGIAQNKLACEYNVCKMTISRTVRRINWTHI